MRNTTAGPVRGYQALTARSATRTDTPIKAIPQSIQVVPRKLIEDQGVVTQSEALRNVSGVRPLDPITFGQLNPKVRGFPAERVVDGLPNYYDAGARDLPVNVERIEVLKGPQGVLFAGGANATGGIINVVSKLPTMKRFAEFGLRLGSYGMVTPWFDINQPLTNNGTVLFRVTGQFEDTKSHINVLKRTSYTLNPTLVVTSNAGTTLTVQGHLSRRQQQDYPGLPIWGTLNRSTITLRRTMFPANPDIPRTSSELQSLTAKLQHNLNSIWSWTSIVRIARSKFNEPSQGLTSNLPSALPATFDLYNLLISQPTTELSANTEVKAKFQVGPTKNTVLAALDVNRVTEKGAMWGDFFGTPVNFVTGPFPNYVPGFFPYFLPNNVYTTKGATFQAHSTIFERLHLLAGVRIANVAVKDIDGTGFRALLTGSSLAKTDITKVLPRIGAAFELFKGFTVFAGYSEGLKPVPFFFGTSPMRPEETKQMEAGVKVNLASTLTATFSVFDLARKNTVAPDPANPFGSVQTGQQRSRGFEADVIWQPNTNWSFLASYAHVDAKVTRDTNPLLLGAPLTGVPQNSGRLWAHYKFTEGQFNGLTIGAGAYAASAQSVELGNPFRTAGFVTFDATASYKYKNMTFSLSAKNLANAKYYLPYQYLSGRVVPGSGTSIFAGISARL
ncbi:MAG: TonB-dependent siderophore receptor [Beijerinckiaceae bacterium]